MNDNLVELNLNENVIETIPIMKFSSLKKLSLYDNKITDIKLL
jgi:Leucine-rich repeat (LRR) protein